MADAPFSPMLKYQYYPDKAQVEVMQALPHRAWDRIIERAQDLNLRRRLPHQGRARVNVYHRTMRYDDLEAVAQLGQDKEEKERLCKIANELAEKTTRGRVSAHWFLPLDGISYAGVSTDEAKEIDLFKLNAFPYGLPRRDE